MDTTNNDNKIDGKKIVRDLLIGFFALLTLGALGFLIYANLGLDKNIADANSRITKLNDFVVENSKVEATIKTYTLENVTFRMPVPWREYSDTHTADTKCVNDASCSKAISLIPGEQLSVFGEETEYFAVEVMLMPNHEEFSPKQIVTTRTGSATKYMKDSSYKIHEYAVFYRRETAADNSYIDISYAIQSDRSNQILYIYARLFRRHINSETNKPDSTKNFLRFEPDIDNIIPTIIFE